MNTIETENLKLKSENKSLQTQLLYLQEQLAWFKKQIFGKRSEKIIQDLDSNVQILPGLEGYFSKDDLTGEVEQQVVKEHTKRKAKKEGSESLSFPEDLPVEQRVLDIAEEEKNCPLTGVSLVEIGKEITRKLAKKPESFFVIEYVRPKYAAPKKPQNGIKIADLPESILPKCQVDGSVLADVICRKFLDHLPLYRISSIYERDGIHISRKLMSKWVLKIGKAIKPLYKALENRVLDSKNIYADETPIDLLEKGKGKAHRAIMWAIAGGKVKDPPDRVYFFSYDRKTKHIKDVLAGYKGVYHSDKYSAYVQLAQDKNRTWCPCWAHIRRKFVESESVDLVFRNWCLRKIKYLFMLDRVAWNRSEAERLRIRQEKSIPIIDELIEKIKDKLINGRKLPKSKYRESLTYFYGLVPYLKNYTKSPYAQLDNNVVERAIRPLAIGRKNWLFFGSQEGGIAAGRILSLVHTCKAYGINPKEYLEDIFPRLLSHNSQNVDELLPGNWKKLSK